MLSPNFSLLYTSVRPALIESVIFNWLNKATDKLCEVVLVVDENDKASQAVAASLEARLAGNCHYQWHIQPDMPGDCVKGWNLAAEKSTGKVLIQITDDFQCPAEWDTKLLALQPANWINEDWAVHVDDGYVRDLLTLAICTRVRYERFGYLFHWDYSSLFSDTEFGTVAYQEGRVIEAMHLLFEHMHPDCQKRARDSVDMIHASQDRWNRGEALFNLRKSRGFPVDVGPMAGKTKINTVELKYCCYTQATRNDFCLQEVCQRMLEEGVKDFFFSIPDEYWSGRATPVEDIAEVQAVADWTDAHGGRSFVKIHKVSKYRFPGDTRIRVETRARNDALAWIRKQGFEHILIVDGDELWKKGTLKYVDDIVRTHRPAAISSMMTPVIGLPGYPVEGATDVAVVYIGGNHQFKECRTPVAEQFRLQMPQVIHFTGTRRTMEEIIAKHKESGHYDDPDYAFDEWLEKVLPFIRPGFVHNWGIHKGLHFFKKYQIWPAVRNWRSEDAQDIPSSLWPYLTEKPSVPS